MGAQSKSFQSCLGGPRKSLAGALSELGVKRPVGIFTRIEVREGHLRRRNSVYKAVVRKSRVKVNVRNDVSVPRLGLGRWSGGGQLEGWGPGLVGVALASFQQAGNLTQLPLL